MLDGRAPLLPETRTRYGMDAARRLSNVLQSPLRMMEKVAVNVADLLVPSKLDMETSSAAAAPPPAKAAVTGGTKRAMSVAISNKKRVKSSPTKVKIEPSREQPFRLRRVHKDGFYNEANLTSLAWCGAGTKKDPITLQ